MRAVTIWQPFASLIMCRAKCFETRSWATHHRGPLAIHAAAKPPLHVARNLYRDKTPAELSEWLRSVSLALAAAGLRDNKVATLPTGAVLGTVNLVDVVPVERLAESALAPERAFGDFSPGRFAWILEDARPCAPLPAKGGQGFWTLPEGFFDQAPPRPTWATCTRCQRGWPVFVTTSGQIVPNHPRQPCPHCGDDASPRLIRPRRDNHAPAAAL